MRRLLPILLLLTGCPSEDPDASEVHAAGFLPVADHTVGTGSGGPCAIAAGDLDRDGAPDLAVSHINGRAVTVLFNQGGGAFRGSWHVHYTLGPLELDGEGGVIDMADLDGDGISDLAVASGDDDRVVLFWGPPMGFNDEDDGGFTKQVLDAGDFPFGVVLADFDGQGNADLAVSNGESDDLHVRMNLGDRSFGEPIVVPSGSREPGFVRTGDLDGNGTNDLVASNHLGSAMSVVLNRGGGQLDPAVVVRSGEGPVSPALGDYDGDGDLDIAVAEEFAGTVGLFWNDGGGAFTAGEQLAAGGVPFYIQPIDFSGDGVADLAVLLEDLDVVAFWENDGAGAFTEVARTAVGRAPGSAVAADVDGDGDKDLMVTNFKDDTISVLLSRQGDNE